jgi:hypothetical protein
VIFWNQDSRLVCEMVFSMMQPKCSLKEVFNTICHKADVSTRQRVGSLSADFVDLVGNVQHPRNNRIKVSRFLNRCCARDPRLESILLSSPRPNVYQHNLPLTDIPLAPPTYPSFRHVYLLSVLTGRCARRSAIFQIAAICGASLVR